MFSSFLSGGVLIYFFHVFQSSIVQRCHITSTALLFAWLGSLASDLRTTVFWKALSAWVVYSNIFFDMHTHWEGNIRIAKHVLLCTIPFIVAYNKMQRKIYQLFFWSIVVIVPDISSNIYGNAIMSEIKIFICCLLIMIRFRHRSIEEAIALENYVWVFLIHDALVVFAILQIYFDMQTKQKVEPVPEQSVEPKLDVEAPQRRKRVIDEKDFPMFFN